jgi:hypothetical protein
LSSSTLQVAGICAGAFFGQTSILECQRLESNQVDCQLYGELLGFPLSNREIGHVEQAWVDVSTDSDGDDTYRVVLSGPHADLPLTAFYSGSYRSKEETAGRINAFLTDPSQTSLQVEQSERWVFILSACFMLIGMLAVGFAFLRAIIRRLNIGRAL